MKRIVSFMMLSLSVMGMMAADEDSITSRRSSLELSENPYLTSHITHIRIEDAQYNNPWGGNWFIELKGGTSVFLGSPDGCSDMFDRISPALQVGIGKWFTPGIGGRIEFQGLHFKNANLQKMDYQSVHADLLWNASSKFKNDSRGLSRWDIIPFVGVGIARNADWVKKCNCPGSIDGSHPFAFSYGIQVRYHIHERLHLIAEFSNMTTQRNFDTINSSSKFGDHMFNMTAGLSMSLGKLGWR